MQTPPWRPRDEERVGVTLSPLLAREVARALRTQALASDSPYQMAS
jgi:hypothetical protein